MHMQEDLVAAAGDTHTPASEAASLYRLDAGELPGLFDETSPLAGQVPTWVSDVLGDLFGPTTAASASMVTSCLVQADHTPAAAATSMMKSVRWQLVCSRLAKFHKRKRSLKARRAATAELRRIAKANAAEVEEMRLRILAVREEKHQIMAETARLRSLASANAEGHAERMVAADAEIQATHDELSKLQHEYANAEFASDSE